MASEVDICNLALAHNGDEANIAEIDPPDGSAQADYCARFYPIARDTLLESHTWRFATKRVVLAAVDNPLTSWQFAYALPSACVRPVSLLPPSATDDKKTEDFVVETNSVGDSVVYTNVEQATLQYVTLVTDTTKFTPLFVVALARLLASYVAGPLIKGESGMKVARAHLTAFEQVDKPRAIDADANARQSSPYNDFTPAGIAARA